MRFTEIRPTARVGPRRERLTVDPALVFSAPPILPDLPSLTDQAAEDARMTAGLESELLDLREQVALLEAALTDLRERLAELERER